MQRKNQAVVTVASGPFADRLDYTFASFAQNPFVNLHAFIVGDRLPERRVPGIEYHLKAPDASFLHPMRDMYYRRMLFLDELEEEYALLVDNGDVLCLQPLPELPSVLRGAMLAACVEYRGSRFMMGQGFTTCYFNTGVTFWNIAQSRQARLDIVERGRTRFRSVEDQLTINEVIHARYFMDTIVLPSQFNFRAHVNFKRRGWPTVTSLDGVIIYHNSYCIENAKRLLPVKAKADLPRLAADVKPLTSWQIFFRRVAHRLEKRMAD